MGTRTFYVYQKVGFINTVGVKDEGWSNDCFRVRNFFTILVESFFKSLVHKLASYLAEY